MYSTDVVKENAYLSATRSGLESNEIATLQRSLPSRFNLRHLKKNESLKLVLQKKAGKSRVVAYKFTSGSFNYTAYRISDKKFYNLSDTSGKGSLDYPLPATARLSSPFNPARLNPVSGKVSPHNGIDYSMPMNTKIVSVIDGKITRAEYNSTMGYFVEVTGKAGVKTRYLHLNKILVTKGARVTRGDAIALSGNSGRSSGPHLHYAFLRSSEDSYITHLRFELPKATLSFLCCRKLLRFLSRLRNVLFHQQMPIQIKCISSYYEGN